MKNFSKLLAAFACVLFLAGQAQAFGQIAYPDRPLNLRAARSARAKWVGSLHPGQMVRIAFMKDGWVAVFEPGETRASESAAVGFSNAKYLKAKPTRVEPKPWGELVYTVRNLNIRKKATVRSPRVDMLKAGERVKIDFPDGDWTMVFSSKATIRSEMNALGYCSSKYFKPVPASEVKSAPKPAPKVSSVVEAGSGKGQVSSAVAPPPAEPAVPPTKPAAAPAKPVAPPAKATQPSVTEKATVDKTWGRVVVIDSPLNLYKERTSTSKPVRALRPGESVRVDFLDRGWYAVFPKNAVVRKESRAMGYALRSLIDGDDGAKATPEPVRASGAASTDTGDGTGRKTLVIDRSRLKQAKRADPTPDKTAHGYQYRLLEKSETKRYGENWITLNVFLAAKTLPGLDALKDFATTLWKEHKRQGKNLAVLIYLPGMDTEDLSFGVIRFSDERMLEVWVRKTTLFGTDFM